MNKVYRYASIGAIVFAPSASMMALFFISRQWLMDEYAVGTFAAFVGAVVIAIGLELVGFLAGHMTADSLNQMGVNVRLWSPALFLAYVIFGTLAVIGALPIHFASFLITFIAYLIYSVYSEVSEEKAKARAEWRWDLVEKSKDKEARRQAKLAQMGQPIRQDTRQDTGNLPTDWRQLTREQRHELAHLTREEREKIMPDIADRTRRAWHERLDKVAAQNGTYLGGN